jgi:CBS domain-containing protein
MTPTLVRDLMTVGVPTCKTSTSAMDVARYLLEHAIEEMVVLDEEGHGVGVCGYEQLLALYGRDDLAALTAEQVMREGVPDLPADLPLPLAVQMMRDQRLRVAYMNHHSGGITYPAGMITYHHLLRCLAAHDEAELKDLGIHAERKSPIEIFIQRRDQARKNNQIH